MLAGALAILTALVTFALSTLGCVLLVALFWSKKSFRVRTFTAAVMGPAALILPIVLLVLTDMSGDTLAGVLGFSFIGALVCGFIGWPVAHIATRRLDRMIQFDIGTFE